jgi:signal transduction histidine kinase
MFILLTVFSTAVIWLTQEGASRLIIDNAQQVTHALAQQSTLALLTESYENAEKALKEVMAFPDVVGAGLVSTQGKLLGWQGEDAGRAFILSHQWGSINEKLFFEEQTDYWHIASVVILSGSQQEDNSGDTNLVEISDEKLGYAIISFSKKSLRKIQRDLFATISISALIAVIGLPLIVSIVINRLIHPLQDLSEVMIHNHETGEHQLANIEGSKEIQRMAESFNSMMITLDEQDDALRIHRDQLEAEVNIRTNELVIARDAAMNSSRYKSEFLANVTHELRSPIQSIIGYVELISEEAENEGLSDIKVDLDKVTRNAERLYALINSLLDLSKIEAGKMELKIDRFYLDQLLKNLEESIAPLVPKNNNRFKIHIECGNPQLRQDSEKLLQVLINLVSNACKFTHNGNIDLIVSTNRNDMVFKVKDTGIGISAEKLEAVFHKFQQLDGSETRKFGGTGLGLAISRQFCDLMHGKLTVSSIEGTGSCFSLQVPVSIA